jgi:hypothetical protein
VREKLERQSLNSCRSGRSFEANHSDRHGTAAIRVLLLHGGYIPHYRVSVYNHVSRYLRERSFELTVTSEQIQPGNRTPVEFEFVPMRLSAVSITRLVWRGNFDVVIMFVDMRHLYLFPVYMAVKGILRRKVVWWGQGRDLAAPSAILKNAAYTTEHALCDAIILYAEHLKKYVARRFHHKIFAANNTLALTYPGLPPGSKENVLRAFNIATPKNIICMGRFQKRKRALTCSQPRTSIVFPVLSALASWTLFIVGFHSLRKRATSRPRSPTSGMARTASWCREAM